MSDRIQDATSLCEFSIILMRSPVTHKNVQSHSTQPVTSTAPQRQADGRYVSCKLNTQNSLTFYNRGHHSHMKAKWLAQHDNVIKN